ncbi:extracellular solute-binding protein [Cohnella thermotolerans]|jgi:multiple sugar transport system substrate-binding protein|uniref:ABC transporter substrate-binding protein n=1 Tax=Cohnella thermotolerans TaxID=329858 RepID=UPI0003F9ECDC|nr:extracellular solute-binding protein [Cohnella thermotolerans]
MKSWKRFAGASAALVLTVALAACGGGNGGGGNSAASPSGSADASASSGSSSGEKVKLRIMWWGSQQRHQATLDALELYTKNNPNVTFEPEYSGMDGYLDKLSTQAAAKNAPDIFQIDPSWVADWASRGQLADLSSGVDLSQVDQKLVDAGKYEGTQYAIPLGSAAYGMIYDKAALEKLGLAAPKNGWTWDDFFALAEAAKPKMAKGQYFTKDYAGDYFAYSAYQYAKGKGLLVTEDGKFNIDKDTFLDWTNKFQKLREEGVVPPADVNASDKEMDPTADLMVKGTVLFRLAFSNQSASYDSLKPDNYAMVTMPRDVEAGGWVKPSLFFGVSSSSKNAEEAKKFLDWFTNSPDAVKILGTTRGNPVNNKVAAELMSSFSKADQIGIDLFNASVADAQQWTPGASGWSNWVDKDWILVRDKLSFKKITPEQAFDELKSTAQEYEN